MDPRGNCSVILARDIENLEVLPGIWFILPFNVSGKTSRTGARGRSTASGKGPGGGESIRGITLGDGAAIGF